MHIIIYFSVCFLFFYFQIKNCIYSEVRSAQFNQNNNRSSQLLVCRTESMIDTKCNIRCPNVALMDILNPTNKNVLYRYEFWLLFFLILLNWVSMAVNTSISDTVCFSLLGKSCPLDDKVSSSQVYYVCACAACYWRTHTRARATCKYIICRFFIYITHSSPCYLSHIWFLLSHPGHRSPKTNSVKSIVIRGYAGFDNIPSKLVGKIYS